MYRIRKSPFSSLWDVHPTISLSQAHLSYPELSFQGDHLTTKIYNEPRVQHPNTVNLEHLFWNWYRCTFKGHSLILWYFAEKECVLGRCLNIIFLCLKININKKHWWDRGQVHEFSSPDFFDDPLPSISCCKSAEDFLDFGLELDWVQLDVSSSETIVTHTYWFDWRCCSVTKSCPALYNSGYSMPRHLSFTISQNLSICPLSQWCIISSLLLTSSYCFSFSQHHGL